MLKHYGLCMLSTEVSFSLNEYFKDAFEIILNLIQHLACLNCDQLQI